MRWPFVGALALMACSVVSRERDDSTATVERTQLHFAQEDEARRFDAALACFSAREGWRAEPMEIHGNFISASWCTWKGSCSSPRNRDEPGARWANVGTLHYPRHRAAPIEVFGVQVSTGRREASGWSVSVSASSNGARILGDHAFVTVHRHGDASSKLTMGLSYGWKVAEQDFSHRVAMEPWAWLDRVRASPEALRSEGLEGWTALHGTVVAALEAGEVRKCVYGPYEGDGIPPECVERVPLSSEEVALELDRVDERLAAVEATLVDPAPIHAALLEVAPPSCF